MTVKNQERLLAAIFITLLGIAAYFMADNMKVSDRAKLGAAKVSTASDGIYKAYVAPTFEYFKGDEVAAADVTATLPEGATDER